MITGTCTSPLGYFRTCLIPAIILRATSPSLLQLVSQSWVETSTKNDATDASLGLFMACRRDAANNRLKPQCCWLSDSEKLKARYGLVFSRAGRRSIGTARTAVLGATVAAVMGGFFSVLARARASRIWLAAGAGLQPVAAVLAMVGLTASAAAWGHSGFDGGSRTVSWGFGQLVIASALQTLAAVLSCLHFWAVRATWHHGRADGLVEMFSVRTLLVVQAVAALPGRVSFYNVFE